MPGQGMALQLCTNYCLPSSSQRKLKLRDFKRSQAVRLIRPCLFNPAGGMKAIVVSKQEKAREKD
ncbi:hypothetical protein J6590_003481 [Homalodisca vitripennis]|nr:hypothetical protein J6590_003481 [Homalodisca vitripennis]